LKQSWILETNGGVAAIGGGAMAIDAVVGRVAAGGQDLKLGRQWCFAGRKKMK